MPSRSNHRNIVAFCGGVQHTHSQSTVPYPPQQGQSPLPSLLHVYNTHREAICCRVGVTQTILHFPGRKKNIYTKIRAEGSFHPQHCNIPLHYSGQGGDAGLCNWSGASALAQWALSPGQCHVDSHGDTLVLAACLNAKLWSDRSGASTKGGHLGTTKKQWIKKKK